MLLSTLLIALSPVWALPTPSPAFAFDPAALLLQRASESKAESSRIARLARTINDVHCADGLDRALASGQSEDGDYAITWQISHEPRSDTYTLAFASPPPEDLLELLASVSPDSDGYHLTPLPREFLGIDSADEVMIYSPFSPYLHTVSQATDALSTFVRPRSMLSAWLSSALSTLGLDLPVHLSSRTPTPRIEVTGQGLGSVLALLTSVRLSTSHPTLPVRATLFSMPKVGNAALGHLVDTLTAQTPLRLERITNGNDPIPSLPPPHHGLHHPTSIVERHGIAHSTTERIAFGRGRIEDAYGPYESVILGVDC